ncbi:c-type cytochrome [Yoonia sediminilitoris]|uniref:Cytochrome c556 n=1 Tax=Yoonia sediminilitoris TaxID=1286148 RepID=A0A2T6KS53_9RHOB|nr:cytochrome c [Yoonia sediminilitoris]PUB19379.1 cytochrome c556 [Yoonia sediminilitoris]RCW99547.1 cytochrome c556 [Yoonia sediminilitoris]
MKRAIKPIALLATAITFTSAAFADGHLSREQSSAIEARQSHMQLMLFNFGPIAAMAQDKAPYDSARAAQAAANLAAVAGLDHTGYWIEGTDSSVGGNRAKAEIWTDLDGLIEANQALVTSTTALADVAGDGIDALKAAFGPVGKSCGDCHETYRTPRN